MPDAVPALSVRLVLNTLREISGPQYERLVTQAGLGRFLANPPADSWAPAATEAEINHMFGVAYQMLGDKGIRLFFRNYSQRLVPLILQSDLMRAKVAEVRSGAIPADRQLAWFVEAMSELANQGWSPVTTSEDRDAYYIEYLNCPLCA